MSKPTLKGKRRPWSKPELRRIEAGSAEAGAGTLGDSKSGKRS